MSRNRLVNSPESDDATQAPGRPRRATLTGGAFGMGLGALSTQLQPGYQEALAIAAPVVGVLWTAYWTTFAEWVVCSWYLWRAKKHKAKLQGIASNPALSKKERKHFRRLLLNLETRLAKFHHKKAAKFIADAAKPDIGAITDLNLPPPEEGESDDSDDEPDEPGEPGAPGPKPEPEPIT